MRRATRGCVVSAALVLTLVAAGATAARADEPAASPRPSASATPSSSAHPAASPRPSTSAGPTASPGPEPSAAPSASSDRPAVAAQVAAAARRVAALQAAADDAGRAAQKAAERANSRRAAAETARFAARDATTAADAAAAEARLSRARAGAVAAQLARADYSTLPLSLMLNGGSASGVLGGLSTAQQLSAGAKQLYADASSDEVVAEALEAAALQKASSAEAAADRAASASTAAKAQEADARTAVTAALAEQFAVLTEARGDGTASIDAVCGALGDTDVAGCADPVEAGRAEAVPTGTAIGDRVVAFARSQIGEPYVFAAAGPSAWDCSGLTLGAWRSVGVSIGIHSATAQYRLARDRGDLVPVSRAVPGDLLFYTDGGGDMYHVAIFSGAGRMVEAPYPGAVVREVPVRQGDLLGTAAHFG